MPLQHPLVFNVPLNVPLNNVLNHRFFAVMAAGVPQVVFGDPGLVGEHRQLAEPKRLRANPVAPPMPTGVL